MMKGDGMRKHLIFSALLLLLSGLIGAITVLASGTGTSLTAADGLKMLKDGNARFVGGGVVFPNQTRFTREVNAKEGQKPFVTVLSCSDSRVPVEMLFDRGLGEIFSVRIAGNVAEDGGVGTMEYGVEHLGTPLLVVLGHTKCGAVTATVQKAEVHGKIPVLAQMIAPAVDKAAKAKPEMADPKNPAFIQAAIDANVWRSIDDIMAKSPMLKERVQKGQLTVVGAMYDITTGEVTWMGEYKG